ncbi:MAG: M81 family metallopeptidase [Verrucomicrobiae bacterium]|nr:M81 family metallopeptidase [Verrucomicrobiae bacterium]MCP5540975.1 M81 family metallopeptidase [Akkermansiaceae bacterium]
MRVGILALLQESNTFIPSRTTLRHFEEDLLLSGEAIRERFTGAKHEIGGFLAGLQAAGIEAVPVFAARAYPHGPIEGPTFDALLTRMFDALGEAGPLDAILAAPHGATVAENHPDADGHWLSRLRESVGPACPIVATLDPHANLSPKMVAATDALIAYRTNPHLDQLETGLRAAALLARTLAGEIRPVQAAAYPPMAINIQRQQTAEPPLRELYDLAAAYRAEREILSDSLILGFPYADVPEMGSATLVVTDDDPALAEVVARELALEMWERRESFEPAFTDVESAVTSAMAGRERITFLDMGDNVGGGGPGDATWLFAELEHRRAEGAFICLHDPDNVTRCAEAGPGAELELDLGGKSGDLHGHPVSSRCRVVSLHEGRFHEAQARHGGFGTFDMGRTAIARTAGGLTAMLTSRRVPPFSLEQLRHCGLDPADFRAFVAKGVIAPMAAYAECSDRFIHVNTPGCTSADMKRLEFSKRRRPLFPFEPDATWDHDAR